MKTGKILVIGGYGHVGRTISKEMGNRFPGQVIVAGRSIQKSAQLSRETKGRVGSMALDIFDPELNVEKALDDVSLVIMCLDQQNTSFVEQIIRKGVDYIDITAASDFLTAMERLDDFAKKAASSVVISIGLEPGLTNLLASRIVAALDETQHIDVFVMLGMGDTHGDAAIQWTLENANAEFAVLEKGIKKSVASFGDGQKVDLPGIGQRTAYRFNFPDQHSLPKTLGVNSVSSYLCFDLEYVTKIFAWLKRTGALRILRRKWVMDLMIQSLKYLNFGSDQFLLKVEVLGKENGASVKRSAAIFGKGEAHMTGMIAAQVAQRVYLGDYPKGVFHIDQLFELDSLISKMIENDLLEIVHEKL